MPDNDNLYLTLVNPEHNTSVENVFLDCPGRAPLLYSQLHSLTAKLQSRLQSLDVSAGDRVIVQVQKSSEAVLLYLACLRAGAIYIPLNPAYTSNELSYFLKDATPQLFICEPDKYLQFKDLATQLEIPHILSLGEYGQGSLLDGFELFSDDIAVVHRNANDLASILYTSGTTGRSKGAMLTHENLRSNTQTLHQCWHWQDDKDVLLHALPIFHIHGLFVALHCAMLGRSKIHFINKFNLESLIQYLPASTVMMGVPTFYTRLLEHSKLTPALCANMRLFVAGSAPLLKETHDKFAQRTGHTILERYGMTECGMIASNPYKGPRIAGTVGFALAGTEARVVDSKGATLAAGETGVLEVKGPNVFAGYWKMPEKTAQEFSQDGYFITGDLACMDSSKRISIVGRSKDLIISGGFNIYPKEIEAEIDLIAGVKESAVIGVPHADFGEAVLAVVVKDQSTPLEAQQVLQSLQGRIAKFKQPKSVVFSDELPRNIMGKVQKNQLREFFK